MESEPARISQLQPSDSVAPYLNNFVTEPYWLMATRPEYQVLVIPASPLLLCSCGNSVDGRRNSAFCETVRHRSSGSKADEDVGCGPGGPPYPSPVTVWYGKLTYLTSTRYRHF